MAYVYQTVTIGTATFPVYANLSTASLYILASINASAYLALDDDAQAQMLVTATRLFDRQCWLGKRTDDDQELEWPRKETSIDGVEDDVIPIGTINGSIEMAIALAAGSPAQDNPTPGVQAIQSLRAGSAAITYFRGAEGVLGIQRFPEIVQELVGKYSCGSQSVSGIATSDTDKCSITRDQFGYNQGM